MFPPIAEASDSTIHQCPPADRTDEKPPGGDPIQFKSLAEAEAWLLSQGFRLVDGTCKWTNDAGDDAGVYSIDGYWGEVKGWRVEINRRAAETKHLSRSRIRRVMKITRDSKMTHESSIGDSGGLSRVSRRSIMQMFIGAAAMTTTAAPVVASEATRPSVLSPLSDGLPEYPPKAS
jgi:hypothetical protein